MENVKDSDEKLTWKDIWFVLKVGFFASLGWNLASLFWAVLKAFIDRV